jgi:hypothetical protein
MLREKLIVANLKVNDQVRSNYYGSGVVAYVDLSESINPIDIKFDNVAHRMRYRANGKYADGTVKSKNISEVNGKKI